MIEKLRPREVYGPTPYTEIALKINEMIDQMNKWEKQGIPHEHRGMSRCGPADFNWDDYAENEKR
jgi:hypothetical protein